MAAAFAKSRIGAARDSRHCPIEVEIEFDRRARKTRRATRIGKSTDASAAHPPIELSVIDNISQSCTHYRLPERHQIRPCRCRFPSVGLDASCPGGAILARRSLLRNLY
jgi:hypothetical protein